MDISIHTAVVTVTIVVLVYTIMKLIYWIVLKMKINNTLKKFSLPYKYSWPLGHLGSYPGPNHEGLMLNLEWTVLTPKMFTVYVTSFKPVLALVHTDTVKALLQTAEPKPVSGFGPYRLVANWLGEGLLVSSGKKWTRNRKLLTPVFHFEMLKTSTTIQNHCSEIFVRKIQQLCKENKSIEICGLINCCTLDIIVQSLFSLKNSLQISDEHKYLAIVEEIKQLIIKRAYNPLLYIDTLYKWTSNGQRLKTLVNLSHQQALDVIHNRRQKTTSVAEEDKHDSSTSNNCKSKFDFLDFLLLARDENGQGLSENEILDEVETFKFEGHDTSSSAISFTLYNLALHTEHQKAVQEELDNVLGTQRNISISIENIKNLSFLKMCIKESLRLFPPVPLICRQLESSLSIEGHTIPAGAYVDVPIWNLHHNPNVWGEDHMMFKPERFSLKNITNIDPFSFIPFSAGPRNCIGQNFAYNNVVVVVGHLLHKFDIGLHKDFNLRLVPGMTLTAENGIKLYFSPRTE